MMNLPKNALVSCPDFGMELRKLTQCAQCQYWGGIQKATVNGEEIPLEQIKFNIVCNRPYTRAVIFFHED